MTVRPVCLDAYKISGASSSESKEITVQLRAEWFAPRGPYPPQRPNTVLSARPRVLRMTSEATLRSHLRSCDLTGHR
jgi:hypothetical protein